MSKTGKPAPKIFRRPGIAAGILLAADLALLAGAVIASEAARSAEVTYTFADGKILKSVPLEFCGIIAALALFLQCALAAVLIAGVVLCERDRKSAAVKITGAALLLAVSAGVTGIFAGAAMGFPPRSVQFFAYTDYEFSVVIEEELPWFSEEATLRVYNVDLHDAELMVSTSLSELSQDAERYAFEWVGENVLRIGFDDGMNYRTLQMTVHLDYS